MIPQEVPPPIPRRPRRTVLYGFFTAQMFWTYVALAQRSTVSFGPLTDYALGRPPAAVSVAAAMPPALPIIIVGFADAPGLLACTVSEAGVISPAGSIATSLPASYLLITDIDRDQKQEVITLSALGSAVSVIKRGAVPGMEKVFQLDVRAQRMIATDINADGQTDILLFGRSMSGVATLLGTPRGRATPGAVALS